MTSTMLKRFNSAAERALKTIVKSGSLWDAQVAYSIQTFYESVSMQAWLNRDKLKSDYHLVLEMHNGVRLAVEVAQKLLAEARPDQVEHFYVDDPKQHRYDVLESLVEIVFDSMSYMSNGFKGFDDIFWHSAIDTFRITFPSIGDAPDGMTAFQQRLALMMIDKLEQNMRGFYPSISRVLLACVGPHEHKAGQKNRTAFNILKDAVYSELQQLPRLAKEKPDKVSDFLPDNVTYDAAKNQLTHTYRDGAQIVTDLNTIDVKPVSLVAPDVRTPT